MSLIYMTLLDDFDIIPTYSWRYAFLACLYKHLCLVRMKGAKHVGKCLLLL